MVKPNNKERVNNEPAKQNRPKNRKEMRENTVEKEIIIEDIGKGSDLSKKEELEKSSMVVDLDGDGNVGNLNTEIENMGKELEKIEDQLQALSDEDGLELVSELRSLLGMLKVGGIANLRQLISQIGQVRKEVLPLQTSTTMKYTPEGKEKSEELHKMLMKLLKELEKQRKEFGLEDETESKLISELRKITINDIEEDPLKVSEMIRDTRDLMRSKERENSLIAAIGTMIKAAFRDKSNDNLDKEVKVPNIEVEKGKEKDKEISKDKENDKSKDKEIGKEREKEKDKDKDKDKDKEISKEKEKTKEKETTKEKGKSNKNIGDDYEPSQNNQLIGILKELANSGDKNKLREVFENHKEELQITNTSNKDITKPIKVNAKMQNLQTEIEEKIRSNNKVIDILKKIDKTIQDRNITIYEPKNPTVDRSKVNGLTLNTPKKDTKEMGMGLDLNKK